VAPQAKLVGIRLLGVAQTAADEAAAFGHRNDVIQIKNNSWGPMTLLGCSAPLILWSRPPWRWLPTAVVVVGAPSSPSPLAMVATHDQSNKDAYANSIHTFAIGALTKTVFLRPTANMAPT